MHTAQNALKLSPFLDHLTSRIVGREVPITLHGAEDRRQRVLRPCVAMETREADGERVAHVTRDQRALPGNDAGAKTANGAAKRFNWRCE